ncbi:MAG: universal stress protein [Candidatus Cybelea sp.]|jgi:hypothetical protein
MNTILVPVDGSECSLSALDVAADLGTKLGTTIVVCHVLDIGRAAAMSGGAPQLVAGCLEALESEGKEIVDEAFKRVTGRIATAAAGSLDDGQRRRRSRSSRVRPGNRRPLCETLGNVSIMALQACSRRRRR